MEEGKAATAVAKALTENLGMVNDLIHYVTVVDHPEEISKLAKVKAQVSEVKGVMMENIEKVLERGEKIEVLVDKTDNLRSTGQFILTFVLLDKRFPLQKILKKEKKKKDCAAQTVLYHPTICCRPKILGSKELRFGGRCGIQNMKIKLIVFGIFLSADTHYFLVRLPGFSCLG
ncbi:unnamed protein product [Rhodiola kirilowii]